MNPPDSEPVAVEPVVEWVESEPVAVEPEPVAVEPVVEWVVRGAAWVVAVVVLEEVWVAWD